MTEKESERVAIIETKIESMETKITDIHTAILGKDSKGGLVTETALNKQSITRLWRFCYLLCAAIVGYTAKSVAGWTP